MRLRFFSGFLLAAFLLAQLALPALAQSGITVLSSTATARFPDSLTFNLRAESPLPITRVVLRYQVDRMSCAPVTSEVSPTFTPGTKIEASWTWDMRKSGGLPPGARVEYSWLLEDASGAKKEHPSSIVEISDSRYSWRSLTAGKVTLYWYRGGEPFARELLNAAVSALEKLARDTGASLIKPVRLYIYDDYEALKGAMVFPQEWTGGVAFTEHGIVAIGISTSNLNWGKGAIAHELAHLVVHQMTFSCYGDLPTWLNEGLAMYAEGELEPYYKAIFQKAISDDKLFSMRSLSSTFPASGDEAQLSYAQSYSLIEFLVNNYGREKMLTLLGLFKEGSSTDEVLKKVYGFDTVGLDSAWRSSVGAKPRPLTPTPTPSAQPQPIPTLVPFGLTPTPGAPAGETTPTPVPTPLPPAKEQGTPVPTPSVREGATPTPTPKGGLFSCQAPLQQTTGTPARGWGNLGLGAGIVVFSGLALLYTLRRR